MNEQERNNFTIAAHKYSDICMNIMMFTDLLKEPIPLIDFITDRIIIQSGLYARYGSANIWVAKHVAPTSIKIAIANPKISNNLSDWSVDINLLEFDMNHINRILKLKVFW